MYSGKTGKFPFGSLPFFRSFLPEIGYHLIPLSKGINFYTVMITGIHKILTYQSGKTIAYRTTFNGDLREKTQDEFHGEQYLKKRPEEKGPRF